MTNPTYLSRDLAGQSLVDVPAKEHDNPEPLSDPVRSEVQLLVRDYFARADAMEHDEP